MNDPVWKLLPIQPTQTIQVVLREWPDGRQESKLISAFTLDDPDYAAIMALVAEGKLTIAEAN